MPQLSRHAPARTAEPHRATRTQASRHDALPSAGDRARTREQSGRLQKIVFRRVVRASLTRLSKPHPTIRASSLPDSDMMSSQYDWTLNPEKEPFACLLTGINPCLFRINLNVFTLAALQKLPQLLQCFF